VELAQSAIGKKIETKRDSDNGEADNNFLLIKDRIDLLKAPLEGLLEYLKK